MREANDSMTHFHESESGDEGVAVVAPKKQRAEEREARRQIIAAALENELVLYFANEDLAIADLEDHERVEQFLDFAKYGEPAPGQPLP